MRNFIPAFKAALVALVFCCAALGTAWPSRAAQSSPHALPHAGDPFPDQKFTAPKDPALAAYLGVAPRATFSLPDVKGEYILLQLFNVYCPHCQAEAKSFPRIWKALSADDLRDRLSFMAVAIGNSPFEVELYTKKYKVTHPVVLDPEYEFHANLGVPGTPTYFLLHRFDGNRLRVVWMMEGRYESPKAFLAAVHEHMEK